MPRKLVVHHRRAVGQSQISDLLELEPKSDRIQNAVDLAKQNLPTALSFEELAEAPWRFSRGISCRNRPVAGQGRRKSAHGDGAPLDPLDDCK